MYKCHHALRDPGGGGGGGGTVCAHSDSNKTCVLIT